MGVAVLAATIALLMTVPGGAVGSPIATGSHPTSSPANVTVPASPSRPVAGGFPGASGEGRVVDAPRIDGTAHSYLLQNGSSGPAPAPPSGLRTRLPSRSEPPAPRPSAPNGWLTGTVLDSVYDTPIVGANVSVSTANGTCDSCFLTNSTGGFRVDFPPGPVELTFTGVAYLANTTTATVVSGAVVPVGEVELVHEATVFGTVVADLPGLPPLATIGVSTVSRDGEESGPASMMTGANGTFRLLTDPIAIEVVFDLSPNGTTAYLDNFTFADPAPWQVVNLGVVRLEGGVTTTVPVVDSTTGLPVPGANGRFCSERLDRSCWAGSPMAGGFSVPSAPGPGYLIVSAPGYVTNVTEVPEIPTGTAGPVALPTVELVPDGVVELTVNFTGGTPNATGASGGLNVTIAACSLSGTSNGGAMVFSPFVGQGFPGGCVFTPAAVGTTVLAPAPPLRDIVYIEPNSGTLGGLPVATDLIPSSNSLYANVTWANVTPDRVTDLGTVGVLAGTYLSGSVSVAGTYKALDSGNVSVEVCSTVRLQICDDSVSTGPDGPGGPIASGCPTAPFTFCAPSPPGPVRVTMAWGTATNRTWVDVPYTCCSQEGHPTPVGAFGLSADVGQVNGTVGIVGAPASVTPPGGWSGDVEVCSAITIALGCFATSFPPAVGPSDSFSLPAPIGWDQVSVAAAGFRENRTWIDVTGVNATGEVELSPFATLTGQIVSATTGAPVLEASVAACNVANGVCLPPVAEADSNGTFTLTLGAFPYPGGSFQIEVTASGFDPESAFTNLTAGVRTVLPPIRLPPVGVSGGVPGPDGVRDASSSTPTTGSWVTGRLLDAASGLGLGGVQISVCLLLASGCRVTPALSSTGGEFNLSTVHGAYQIWFNSTHAPTDLVYLNATTAGTVALGDLNLTAYPRFTGRVVVGPWATLAATVGLGAGQTHLVLCDPAGDCGPVWPANSGGFFNVSAPVGTDDPVTLSGGGPATWGGQNPAGFSTAEFSETIAPSGTRLVSTGPGGAYPLPLLGGVAGWVNETGGAPARPAMFVGYTLTGSPNGAFVTYLSGSGGNYVGFVPAGETNVTVGAGAASLVSVVSSPSAATTAPGVVTGGPALNATRFGFVTAEVVAVGTGTPLGAIPLTAFAPGLGGGQMTGDDASNGSGTVNVSAPPGNDSLGVNDPAFGAWVGNVTVPAGASVAYGTISLTPLPGDGIAVVRTEQVNSLAAPIVPGAYDNVSGRPVPGAGVEENAFGVHVGPLNDSDLGEFFLAVTPDSTANVTVAAAGFDPYTVGEDIQPGQTIVLQPLHLTAGGILTGTVVAEPGNVTVPYAVVSVCPLAFPTCETTVETNATGGFWVGAPSGYVTVAVESNVYLTNLTRLVDVPPDGFVELGNVAVFGFGTVRGVVRGLPNGALLPGANVSVCSEYSPPGGCLPDESVTADANASFAITSPPGVYVLYVTEPGYNATRLELLLGAGADLDLGVVFLESYGIESGTVVTLADSPVPNATVLSCATYPGGSCGAPASTNGTGGFWLLAPPGANVVTVSAPGYLDAVVAADVVSGALLDLPPIVLVAQPPEVDENISGVVTGTSSGAAIPGAVVQALEGAANVGQATARSDGAYTLTVPWGTVTLRAGFPGYREESQTTPVHANVSGVNFSLPTMTYAVRGETFDGGSGSTLANVTISEDTAVLATTTRSGSFDVSLPNGSYPLVASHAPSGVVAYGDVRFVVAVSGRPVVHDLTLPRTIVPMTGSVVDAATGHPVPAAAVTIWTPNGAALSNASTDGSGSFTFAVGPGNYNVSVTAPGYETANVTVATGAGGNHTTVALLLRPTPAPPPAAGFPLVAVGVGAAFVAIAVAAAYGVARTRRSNAPVDPPPEEPADSLLHLRRTTVLRAGRDA
ncbi:MAG: carboxypeptidase regulatory-like domain-containing protein [Thermoplasmata archaeon]|nr:carboxypeptidase regulatory-like domain-containing protein [Thermoplasmata archaeon]